MKLWSVKISTYDNGKRQLYEARTYRNFRKAMDDVLNASVELFDNVPEEWLPKEHNKPDYVVFGSVGKNNIPDDLEIRYYKDGNFKTTLVCYIGTMMIEDERR